ncbi:MAG TPA: HAMP domain-containing sensor histidine kinase [Vicinamibacterales bacterium]|nr:HAMP domain-containing sensor histidine kinase [Vicinamibacterales bacterium]
MTLRARLFVLVGLVVAVSVALVTITISAAARRSFEALDRQRTSALIAQFRREFVLQGDDVARRIDRLAASDVVQRTAVDLARHGDPAPFAGDAAPMAAAQGLDFFDLVAADGTIISSAEWPARFGYRHPWATTLHAGAAAFLQTIELPHETALGLVAVRQVSAGIGSLYIGGGERLDQQFLRTLRLPDGMRVFLYRNVEPEVSRQQLLDVSGQATAPAPIEPLIARVRQTAQEASDTIESTDGAEFVSAIPLTGSSGEVLGVLLLASSGRELAALLSRIRWSGVGFGVLGLIVGAALSYAAATQVTRPVEVVAEAADRIAGGDWDARVGEVSAGREIDALARAFDTMAAHLVEQRDRLVQVERVAAWRELARRLAHELKNPLFPLRITLDNLRRARTLPAHEFEEVLDESLATLDTGFRNLNVVVGRFGDFARMPAPIFEDMSPNAIAEQTLTLVRSQIEAADRPAIRVTLDLDPACGTVRADGEQMGRVMHNLVLNAVDAMPTGGDLTIRTRPVPTGVRIDVADTGEGLTDEERARLFTPYYTTKQHGTGLGLAIVQSVVADHSGRVWVDSAPGRGSTFHIELPRAPRDAAKGVPA